MRTLAVSNYKGGVGKTTMAVNLAAIYAVRGLRVLLIDLDPQASATDYFGLYDRAAADGRMSIQLLYESAPVADVAYETEMPNLHVVSSIIGLTDQNELMLRVPVSDFRILRTCVPGRMTNAEKTSESVLD